MRLDILNRGYTPGTKVLFAVIRLFSGRPVPDAAKLVFYRPGFYGANAKRFTHEAMRGPSAWSVADRELMAAFVSQVSESAFCVGAHTATAARAYHDGAKVQAVLADLESAPVEEGLRATLASSHTCAPPMATRFSRLEGRARRKRRKHSAKPVSWRSAKRARPNDWRPTTAYGQAAMFGASCRR